MLRLIAAVSGIYDFALGLVMLFLRDELVRRFGVPAPAPPIHADLNGVFLLAVGLGYSPERHRGYLWVMGPGLKGAGALTFVLDHVVRHSPGSFLVFAAVDGTLAAVTLAALLATARRDISQ
jgi:hypothetical protein